MTREFLVEAQKMLQPRDTRADDVGGIGTSQGSQNPTRRWTWIAGSDSSLQLP